MQLFFCCHFVFSDIYVIRRPYWENTVLYWRSRVCGRVSLSRQRAQPFSQYGPTKAGKYRVFFFYGIAVKGPKL